jgi:hypothetical protein
MDMESLLQSGTSRPAGPTASPCGRWARSTSGRRARRRRLQLDLRRDVPQGPALASPGSLSARSPSRTWSRVGAGLSAAGQDPLLLDLRQVRHPRLRPDRDGDQLRREPQDRRQPRGHHARLRRPQPDVPARRRVVPLVLHHEGPPRQPGLLRPAARRRVRGVRPHQRDGRVRGRLLHADPPPRHRVHLQRRRPSSTWAASKCSRGRDIVLCAAGYMVHEANKAIDLLDKAGISATLVDLYSLPFDTEGAARPHQRQQRHGHHARGQLRRRHRLGVADALTESGDAFTAQADARQAHPQERPPQSDARGTGPSLFSRRKHPRRW